MSERRVSPFWFKLGSRLTVASDDTAVGRTKLTKVVRVAHATLPPVIATSDA